MLKRRDLTFTQAADDLAAYLADFLRKNRRDRVRLRNRVESFSENFAWTRLISNYQQAHDLAASKLG